MTTIFTNWYFTWMLFSILLGLLTFYIIKFYMNNIFYRMKIPGPRPIPVFGSLLSYLKKGLYQYDMELIIKYGKIVGVFEGAHPIILLADTELLRKVLIKDFHLFTNRRRIEGINGPPLNHGLFSLQNDEWKRSRSNVSPTFTTSKLKDMFSLVDHCSRMLNIRLSQLADNQEMFEARGLASCLFGIEINSLQNENLTMVQHLKSLFTVTLGNPIIIIYIFAPRLARYLVLKGITCFPKAIISYLTHVLKEVLLRRRNGLENRNDFIQIMVDQTETHNSHLENTDKVETPTKQYLALKDDEIIGQALIFFIAGFETTASLLSFFMYALAVNPHVQEKVFQEICSVCIDENGMNDISYEKIGQLHYLDAVINETLRMYPPVTRFDRESSVPCELGGYMLPTGTIITVPVYWLHHDPDVWENPEQFIPERFYSSEKLKRDPLYFVPFGIGPRSCVGMRFAIQTVKLAIVQCLYQFEICTCEKTTIPLKFEKALNIFPQDQVWLCVNKRSL